VKKVTQLSYDAVERMAGAEVRERWQKLRRWLEEDGSYERVPVTREVPKGRLSLDDVLKLQDFGVIEEVSEEEVRGGVRVFTVGEPAKQRRRPIKNTADVNEIYGKESLLGVSFPSKAQIVAAVHKGSHMAAFDMAAWYDHFVLEIAIRNRFCFRAENGKTYRLRVLGMGQRQACEIAQTATDAIRDFDKASAFSLSIIDNVLFVGSASDCEADSKTFFQRAREANATVNDVASEQEAAAVVSTSGDWGGIHLDFSAKTVCLAGKAVAKTRASFENRDSWTYRLFAAHVGLLFWSVGIVDIPVHKFFDLLHFVGEVGRRMQANPERWDEPIEVWPCAWPNLQEWTRLVIANTPRRVPERNEPDLFVTTDASAWGWGFVAFDAESGAAHHHGERWRRPFVQRYGKSALQRSVFTEPHGIVNAMCRLLRADKPRTVRIGTDNAAAEASFRRGFNSRSFHLNACVSRLRLLFPSHQFELVHVPGPLNPADGVSRGLAAPIRVDVEGLRRVLGCAEARGLAIPH
jgi:hypothetical protein